MAKWIIIGTDTKGIIKSLKIQNEFCNHFHKKECIINYYKKPWSDIFDIKTKEFIANPKRIILRIKTINEGINRIITLDSILHWYKRLLIYINTIIGFCIMTYSLFFINNIFLNGLVILLGFLLISVSNTVIGYIKNIEMKRFNLFGQWLEKTFKRSKIQVYRQHTPSSSLSSYRFFSMYAACFLLIYDISIVFPFFKVWIPILIPIFSLFLSLFFIGRINANYPISLGLYSKKISSLMPFLLINIGPSHFFCFLLCQILLPSSFINNNKEVFYIFLFYFISTWFLVSWIGPIFEIIEVRKSLLYQPYIKSALLYKKNNKIILLYMIVILINSIIYVWGTFVLCYYTALHYRYMPLTVYILISVLTITYPVLQGFLTFYFRIEKINKQKNKNKKKHYENEINDVINIYKKNYNNKLIEIFIKNNNNNQIKAYSRGSGIFNNKYIIILEIGKINKINSNDINKLLRAIVSHELGHIHLHIDKIRNLELVGSLLGIGRIQTPSILNEFNMEYEADDFGMKLIGKNQYIDGLKYAYLLEVINNNRASSTSGLKSEKMSIEKTYMNIVIGLRREPYIVDYMPRLSDRLNRIIIP